MVNIKAMRGKAELAYWYAFVCSKMAKCKINFGSPAANNTDYRVQKNGPFLPT